MQQLNNVEKNIEFTMESITDGTFLDFIIRVNENRELSTEVHRKTNALANTFIFLQINLNMWKHPQLKP